MTKQIQPGNNGNVSIDSGEEGTVYTLPNEIQATIGKYRRHTPRDVGEVHQAMIGDILPLLRDLSAFVKQNSEDIDLLMADAEGLVTRISGEDAEKLEKVISFALVMAQKVAADEAGDPNMRAEARLMATQAEECLLLLEESAIEEDDEEEDGEDEEEEKSVADQN